MSAQGRYDRFEENKAAGKGIGVDIHSDRLFVMAIQSGDSRQVALAILQNDDVLQDQPRDGQGYWPVFVMAGEYHNISADHLPSH